MVNDVMVHDTGQASVESVEPIEPVKLNNGFQVLI